MPNLFLFFAYAEYDLNDNHTTDKKHGLWEVRACAVDFLYNEEKNIIYRDAMEQNLKIFVPRCVVPLRAIWTSKSKELPEYTISVICDRAVGGGVASKWSVEVLTKGKKQ